MGRAVPTCEGLARLPGLGAAPVIAGRNPAGQLPPARRLDSHQPSIFTDFRLPARHARAPDTCGNLQKLFSLPVRLRKEVKLQLWTSYWLETRSWASTMLASQGLDRKRFAW